MPVCNDSLSPGSRSSKHPFAKTPIRMIVWVMAVALIPIRAYKAYQLFVVHGHLADFGRLYYAVLAWRGGGGLYTPTVATPEPYGDAIREMVNVATPSFHLIVWPFTWLSPSTAFVCWVACNAVAWACSLRICLREWQITLSPPAAATLAIGIAISTLTSGAFETGQYVGLLMLPATLAWRAARRSEWAMSGVWLGLVASQKPFVFIFVPWLMWHRRWRGAIAAALVTIVSVALGEMVFGRGIHLQWQTVLRSDVSAWGWLFLNASTAAPWMRAFGPSPAFSHSQNTALMGYATLGSAAVIACITAWRVRRGADLDLSWAVLWTAALLISPIAWTYYLWWAAGPLGATLIVAWQTRPALRQPLLLAAACFVLPLPTFLIGQPSVTASFTLGSTFTWALVVVWVAAVSDHRLASLESRAFLQAPLTATHVGSVSARSALST